MKIKLCMQVSLFLFVLSLLFPGPSLQNEREKIQENKERKSLIRKELLLLEEKTLSPPKRNIFTRTRANMIGNEFAASYDFQMPGQRQTPGQPEPGQPEQKEPVIEEIQADVRYIGYVKSGDKVVALIIFENEIYAVESGDVLGVGLTIGDITPDEMEIYDKGSEPRRVILEGE